MGSGGGGSELAGADVMADAIADAMADALSDVMARVNISLDFRKITQNYVEFQRLIVIFRSQD